MDTHERSMYKWLLDVQRGQTKLYLEKYLAADRTWAKAENMVFCLRFKLLGELAICMFLTVLVLVLLFVPGDVNMITKIFTAVATMLLVLISGLFYITGRKVEK